VHHTQHVVESLVKRWHSTSHHASHSVATSHELTNFSGSTLSQYLTSDESSCLRNESNPSWLNQGWAYVFIYHLFQQLFLTHRVKHSSYLGGKSMAPSRSLPRHLFPSTLHPSLAWRRGGRSSRTQGRQELPQVGIALQWKRGRADAGDGRRFQGCRTTQLRHRSLFDEEAWRETQCLLLCF